MKKWGILCFAMFCLAACKPGNKAPDVSAITVDMQVQRFDKDFFAIDPHQLQNDLNALSQKYPDFFPPFLVNVLGIHPSDSAAATAIISFIRSYKGVYDTADKVAESNLPALKNNLAYSLQLFKYYVPQYALDSPFIVTTFIGPMDAFEPFALGDYGDVRTANGVGIALQFHLGSNASVYEEGRQAGIFYDYQTLRFTPETMLVNAMKNIVSDAFPLNAGNGTLLDEMLEKGKRMYLLDLVLPTTPEHLKLGYTEEQLKGCYANEALIWNYFVKNDLLYTKENSIKQNYVKDGPKTPELGEGAPGYIGLFTGLEVVRSYMKNHPETTMEQLMELNAASLLNEAGYKP